MTGRSRSSAPIISRSGDSADLAFCGFSRESWSTAPVGRVHCHRGAARRPLPGLMNPPGSARTPTPGRRSRPGSPSGSRTLPKPIGIMACNDLRGQHVLDACNRIDLAVPEEVAVIGVDDEEEVCELCDPPLTSIIPNAELVGYKAAELLDRLMSGKPRPRSSRSSRPPAGDRDPAVDRHPRHRRPRRRRRRPLHPRARLPRGGRGGHPRARPGLAEHPRTAVPQVARLLAPGPDPPDPAQAGQATPGRHRPPAGRRSASWPDSSTTSTCAPYSSEKSATRPGVVSAARPRNEVGRRGLGPDRA